MPNGRKAKIIYTCCFFIWIYQIIFLPWLYEGISLLTQLSNMFVHKSLLYACIGFFLKGTIILIFWVIWSNLIQKSTKNYNEYSNKQKILQKKIALLYITSLVLVVNDYVVDVLIEVPDLNSYIIISFCDKMIIATVAAIVIYKRYKNDKALSIMQSMNTKKKIALIYIICLADVFRTLFWSFLNNGGSYCIGNVIYRIEQNFIQGTIVLIVLIVFGIIKMEFNEKN